jgi:hypothetical protein
MILLGTPKITQEPPFRYQIPHILSLLMPAIQPRTFFISRPISRKIPAFIHQMHGPSQSRRQVDWFLSLVLAFQRWRYPPQVFLQGLLYTIFHTTRSLILLHLPTSMQA